MNVRKMRLIYGGVILISLLVIGFTINYYYDQMGGYEVLEVYDLKSEHRVLVGKRLKSRRTNPEFTKQYNRCKEIIANHEINGKLTVLNYYSDSLKLDEFDQFIGITLDGDMAEVPIDFEIMEVETGIRYVVFLGMHPLVRPTSNTIESIILAKAQEDSLELLPLFNEFHYSDNSMSVEGWIKSVPVDSTKMNLEAL